MYLSDEIIKSKISKENYIKILNYRSEYLDFDEDLLEKYIGIINEYALLNNCEEYALLFTTLDGELRAKYQTFYHLKDNKIIKSLSKEELLNSEVDASSLTNGGLREIIHAKGILSINTNEKPFIIDKTLFIPTYINTLDLSPLDDKNALYKSIKELRKIIKEVLNKLDYKVDKIMPYLGIEQEFYIMDKKIYENNKSFKYLNYDILNDNYNDNNEYLKIIDREEFQLIKEIEQELTTLNIYPKSIHKEVGKDQFEIAPIYKIQNESLRDSQIIKIIIQNIAKKHNKVAIFNEKPFLNISGSGQHNNYSLFGDNINLLKEENPHYLLILSAFIMAIDKYSELISFSCFSYSNERRLGLKEAPNSKITIDIGDELEDILKNINNYKKIMLDRNRTAPIAFLENRFEFRTIGSSLDSTFLNICLNTMLIDAFKEINIELIKGKNEIQIVKKIYDKHHKIIYNGNNYLNENKKQNFRELIEYFNKHKHIFIDNDIYNQKEINARINIYKNKYLNDLIKEYRTLDNLIKDDILPKLNSYLIEISKINEKYINEYNQNCIEFIKQISDKFNNYRIKIKGLLTRIIDIKDVDEKIKNLEECEIINDIKDCYNKINEILPKDC